EGVHRIAVEGRPLFVDVRPNPSLNVFLSLDRNTGTLVVKTNEDGVKVFLNNRLYARTTEHRMLRLSLDVSEYSIRVEKEGFQPTPATQAVTLKKGEEKPLTFTLTRMPAYLQIEGAEPGAQVKMDNLRLGEILPGGGFQRDVP